MITFTALPVQFCILDFALYVLLDNSQLLILLSAKLAWLIPRLNMLDCRLRLAAWTQASLLKWEESLFTSSPFSHSALCLEKLTPLHCFNQLPLSRSFQLDAGKWRPWQNIRGGEKESKDGVFTLLAPSLSLTACSV